MVLRNLIPLSAVMLTGCFFSAERRISNLNTTEPQNGARSDLSDLKTSDLVYEIHVVPGANPNGTGAEASPLGTLQDALSRQREIRAAHPQATVHVLLESGRYELKSPLSFDGRDSGPSPNMPVIWRTKNPANGPAILTVSRQITAQPKVESVNSNGQTVYSVDIGDAKFSNIYFGEREGIRARMPNQGSVFPELIPQSLQHYPSEASLTVQSSGWQAWAIDGSTVCASGTMLHDTEIVLNKTWAPARHKISSIYRTGNGTDKIVLANTFAEVELCLSTTVKKEACNLSENSFYGPFYHYDEQWKQRQPYYFENNLCFIDQEGEWYADFSAKKLFFTPPAGFNPGVDAIFVPDAKNEGDSERILSVGTAASRVENISFEGIRFAHTDWLFARNRGFFGWSGASYVAGLDGTRTPVIEWVPAAVMIVNSKNVAFRDSEFVGMGAVGLALDKPQSQKVIIDRCRFSDIAGSAISTLSYDVVFDDITVTNSTFTNIGRRFGGNGIQISSAKNVVVENNDLSYVSSMGITFSTVKDGVNSIAKNRLRKVTMDYGDSGAIYTNTTEPNIPGVHHISIVENVINDIEPASFFANPAIMRSARPAGIYLDFYTGGASISRNTISNAPFGFRINCSRGNLVFQNLVESVGHLYESGCAGISDAMAPVESDGVGDSGEWANNDSVLAEHDVRQIEANAGPAVGPAIPVENGPDATGAATHCMVEVRECFNNVASIGSYQDGFENANNDKTRCLKRAADYANWCQNNHLSRAVPEFSVTATFVRNEIPVATHSANANGCMIQLSTCRNGVFAIAANGRIYDNFDNAGSNANRCVSRAQEYHDWCGNQASDFVKSFFWQEGRVVRTGESR